MKYWPVSSIEPKNVEGAITFSLYCIQNERFNCFRLTASSISISLPSIFSKVRSSFNVYLLLEKTNLKNKEFKEVKFCQNSLSFQLSKELLRSHMNANIKK